MPHLISFDIDGTLVTGDGPGPITLEMVRRAVDHGHIIGSASDRTVANQIAMWASVGISVAFTINKHKLDEIRARYDAEFYYHIGDTDLDRHFATLHGFEFLQVQTMDPHPWMHDEAGQVLWGPQGRGPLEVPTAPGAIVPPHAQAEEHDYTKG